MPLPRSPNNGIPPILILILILGGLLLASLRPGLSQAASKITQASQASGTLRAFDLLTPQAGWALLDQTLYRTADGGNTWAEITPPGSDAIWSVFFLDEQRGWTVVSPVTDPGSPPGFQLLTTLDGGDSWDIAQRDFDPFPDLYRQYPADVFLTFVDPQNGWVVFKRPTSSNFSQGTLFRTQDGGTTWQRLAIPLGEPVRFEDQGHGFVERPFFEQGYYAAPARFETFDGGQSWQPVLAPVVGDIAIYREFSGPEGPVSNLDAVDEYNWFGIERIGDCAPGVSKASPSCTQTRRLVRSRDGGQTWQPLALPLEPSAPAAPDLTTTGQAFDKCEVASLPQLQEWWIYSPYSAVNLYIGGVARSCTNAAITPVFLSQLDRQGWSLIPTWVGPQAACSNYLKRMSYDTAAAYQEGYNEADAAAATAQNLKLWGQVIYYDLEGFDSANLPCLEAAEAFINGWTFRLHEWGFLPGVYGSPCNSGLQNFWSLANVPDAVWIAHWLTPAKYNPNATVWTNVCGFSNTYWPNHQRLRQYAGPHTETWGSVGLIIDSNVMDGIVARAFGQPPQACPQPAPPAVAGVILYTGSNYDCYTRQAGFGYIWRSTGGLQNLGFFDNRASSIYVPPGWSVQLYENLNRGGGKACLNAAEANFTGLTYDNGHSLDNSVSSFEVFSAPNCVSGGSFPAVDSTPPQVAITSHVTGGYIAGSVMPVTVIASIQDSGSGISHAQFFAGADSGSGWAWQALGWDVDGSDGWSAQWTPGALGDSTDVGLYVYAWDQAGNPAGASALHLSVDSRSPVSTLQPLPSSLDTTIIQVAWQGTDDLSGVDHYDIQVREDSGAWQDWLSGVSAAQTSAAYYGQPGHTYGFRARAADRAGNQEAYPSGAETSVAINPCTDDAFEPDDGLASARSLAIGEMQSHNLCGLADEDWLAVQAIAGQAYIFSTGNLGVTTDTVISLWGAPGNKLAESDDAPGVSDGSSLIFWTAPANATVYLRVTHADSRVAGDGVTYDVAVRLAPTVYLPIVSK